jgi:hypothetical protein
MSLEGCARREEPRAAIADRTWCMWVMLSGVSDGVVSGNDNGLGDSWR